MCMTKQDTNQRDLLETCYYKYKLGIQSYCENGLRLILRSLYAQPISPSALTPHLSFTETECWCEDHFNPKVKCT